MMPTSSAISAGAEALGIVAVPVAGAVVLARAAGVRVPRPGALVLDRLAAVAADAIVGAGLLAAVVAAMLGADIWASLAIVAFGGGCYATLRAWQDARRRRAAAAQGEPEPRRRHEDLVDLLLDGRASGEDDWLWETDDRLALRGDLARVAQATGLGVERLDGLPLSEIIAADAEGGDTLMRALARHDGFRDAIVQVSVQPPVWWRLSAKPVLDAAGRFVGYQGIASDVTALREAQARIAHLATHDALTGLPNRQSFQHAAARACAAASQRPAALLLLDLDGFKQVNDRLGHAVGDELLAAVAQTLARCAPAGATLARLGGDEFAILAEANRPQAETLALTLCRAIGDPFALGDHRVTIGVSVGIALAPDHADEPRSLARKADLALYKAKAAGRGVHAVFRDVFEREIEERLRLEADIRIALERGEFTMHYQPLFDVAEGVVAVCEALMRWSSTVRGDVSPGIFVPAAERSDLIVALGRFALARACADAAGWPLPARVAVNISPQHLRSAEFKADVVAALRASGLPPSRLEIEVTEGVFLDRSSASLDALTWLRERGIKVALDDFGTGFSSLNYLIDFPVDKIKIDRAFIAGFLQSRQSRAVVDAILMLARELDIRVVAEGVETVDQALALKLRRCDDLQGYLIARPQPAGAIGRLLTDLPDALRARVPGLLESSLVAALALKRSA